MKVVENKLQLITRAISPVARFALSAAALLNPSPKLKSLPSTETIHAGGHRL